MLQVIFFMMRLTKWSVSHLIVDMVCFIWLFAAFSAGTADLATRALGFLTYNCLAFGLQPVIGYWTDMSKKDTIVGAAGCILVASGLFLSAFSYAAALLWISLVLITSGNAVFHAGGGAHILRTDKGRMADIGIFISGGALGVAGGTWLGIHHSVSFLALIVLLVLTAGYLFFSKPIKRMDQKPLERADQQLHPQIALSVLVVCLLTILFRAFAGSYMPVVWKSNTDIFLFLLPAISAFVGKFSGGLLADRFGAKRTAVVSMMSAMPMLFLLGDHVLPSVMGFIAINMTTAITAKTIADTLPGKEGFAFGLTTLALLIGVVPSYFFVIPYSTRQWLLPLLIAVVTFGFWWAFTNQSRRKKDEKNTEALAEGITGEII